MFTLHQDDVGASAHRELTASDLAIHQFDSWGNAGQPMVNPTTACWFEPELATDSAVARR